MSKQNQRPQNKSLLSRLFYFFPLQLLFVHLKKNQQLLLFWLLLFLAIFKKVGLKYGIPYLFLAPEYLGKISLSSFFIVGFAVGGFVTAFNISSYIMNGFRFPFLATLSKPFLKYSINNATIPLVFILCYSLKTYEFLTVNENLGALESFYRIASFLMGYVLFLTISMIYFLATNKSFEKIFGKELTKVLRAKGSGEEAAKDLLIKKNKWYRNKNYDKSWRVDSYFTGSFKIRATRACDHYDNQMLSQVFRQNHINASLFEIVILISIIILGIYREKEIFNIPAAATITLIFTMLLMVTSAIRSWIRGWTILVIIGFIICINQLSKYDNFYYQSHAYGLDYSNKVEYPVKANTIDALKVNQDLNQTIGMLEEWKKKVSPIDSIKPKAIFIASSGGGARAAFWSFLALQRLDSLSNGALMDHTIMCTGSSGGMIGTAYYRELLVQKLKQGLNPHDPIYKMDMSRDILNPITFNLAVNDLLIRTKKFNYDGINHWKDRGYVFEKTLIDHSHGYLDKKLIDYKELEEKAVIPQLIFSPSIVDDSKRMLISTLPLSFLCQYEKHSSENVDYLNLFENNNALNIRFTNVLRMNSSFPYIMPTVSMPTKPSIEVFDSGLRDNYGIKLTLKYIYHLREWLSANTSGIIILQIRDGLKDVPSIKRNPKKSIIDELASPFGSLYGNWFEVQDYNNDELFEYMKSWYSGKVDVLEYQLNKSADNYISLSWHLTNKEKQQILNSINIDDNVALENFIVQELKN